MENKAAKKEEKWNWLIAAACFCTMFTTMGVLRITGVLFTSITHIYGVTREEAAWPFFVRRTVARLTGLIVGILSQYFDARTQVIGGILLCSVGIGACYFATDVFFITLTFGILYGFGSGIVRTSNQITINRTFSRYRTVASGVILAGTSLGSFVFPPFTDFLLDIYGLNGTFLLISGFLLQGLVAAALYRNPQNASNTTTKKLQSSDQSKIPDNSSEEDKKYIEPQIQVATITPNDIVKNQINSDYNNKNYQNYNKEILLDIDKIESSKCSDNKFSSEKNVACSPPVPKEKTSDSGQKQQCTSILLSYLGIFRFPMFYVIFISSSTVGLSLYTYLTTIVDHAMDCGVERHKAIYLLSACGISELCGRLGCGWITDLGLLKRTNVIKFCSVALAVTFVVMPWTDNYILLVALAVCLGFLASCLVVNNSVLYIEYLGKSNLAYAVGMGTTLSGSVSLALPSIIGYFRDITGSYTYLFYMFGCLHFSVAVLWLIEPILVKFQQKLGLIEKA